MRVVEFQVKVLNIPQLAPVLATTVFNYFRLNFYLHEFAYKKLLIEHFKGYRLVFVNTTRVDKQASYRIYSKDPSNPLNCTSISYFDFIIIAAKH